MSNTAYATITARIVAELENGTRPWVKPWTATGAALRPRRVNGEAYTGVNVLALWASASDQGIQGSTWMTYKQAQELGGQVRKGSKGTTVVYASQWSKTETNAAGVEVTKKLPFLKQYSVFAVEQIDGLDAKFYSAPVALGEVARIEAAETFFANVPVEIRTGGDRAYYSPSADYIQMPERNAFRDSASYYATLAHEAIHSTGHTSRLARPFGAFATEAYAEEELVAEIGSAYLCADLQLTPDVRDDHAQYIAHWITALKRDANLIGRVASAAQKAATLLTSYQPTTPANG